MSQHDLHIKTNSSTTKCNTLFDHVWTNILGNDSKTGTTEAYWPDYHKHVYFSLKLPNHILIYNLHTYNYNFI